MYHDSVVCGSHDDLFLEFSCTRTLVPGGPIGCEVVLSVYLCLCGESWVGA
jgi:hypothetical protein